MERSREETPCGNSSTGMTVTVLVTEILWFHSALTIELIIGGQPT